MFGRFFWWLAAPARLLSVALVFCGVAFVCLEAGNMGWLPAALVALFAAIGAVIMWSEYLDNPRKKRHTAA